MGGILLLNFARIAVLKAKRYILIKMDLIGVGLGR